MRQTRRLRGLLLRLARRPRSSIALGVLLVLPAVWIEWLRRDTAWWIEGLSLIAGATGVALLWTGMTGVRPDWIDDEP